MAMGEKHKTCSITSIKFPMDMISTLNLWVNSNIAIRSNWVLTQGHCVGLAFSIEASVNLSSVKLDL